LIGGKFQWKFQGFCLNIEDYDTQYHGGLLEADFQTISEKIEKIIFDSFVKKWPIVQIF
jgi:hypothetical protein